MDCLLFLVDDEAYSTEADEMLRSLTCNQVVQCQSIAASEHNSIPYIHIISHINGQVCASYITSRLLNPVNFPIVSNHLGKN